MSYPQSYNGQVPLGKMSVTAAGTTTALSVNCGSFAGQEGTPSAPPNPGASAIKFFIQASTQNTGNLYLLPRGKTAAGNPTLIFAVIGPGGSIEYPGISNGPGMQPENYVLDTDAVSGTQVAYGYATLQG